MSTQVEWFKFDPKDEWGEDEEVSVGEFDVKEDSKGNLLCPLCAKRATYNEGEIGQDQMGNDIYGWWYTCWGCHVTSEAVEEEQE